MGRPRALLQLGLVALLALACGEPAPPPPASAPAPGSEPAALPAARIGPGPHDVAILDLGALGTLRIELLPEIAPETVANFVKLAEEGFYDGTYFHRVIPGFMIQGGDPATKNGDPRDDGRGHPGYTIPDEFTTYAHRRGTVSMANNGWPESAGSQFFIVHADSLHLDGRFTAFGRVVEGTATLDRVTELERDVYGRYGPVDRPYPENATLHGVRIERAESAVASASDPLAPPAATR